MAGKWLAETLRQGRDPAMLVYRGERQPTGERLAWVEIPANGGVWREPVKHLVFHSPDGFEWGYGGSGPADLSLALLADFLLRTSQATGLGVRIDETPEYQRAFALHQDFKWDVVARLEHEAWTVAGEAIATWLAAHGARPPTLADAERWFGASNANDVTPGDRP
jgi:hypothetical protein